MPTGFGVVVSSMALRYFDAETTVQLMGVVQCILAPGGVLHARVPSINYIAFGAGSGREVEMRYYDHGGYVQRYLSEDDVCHFFAVFGTFEFFEEAMTRLEAYYARSKMMWTIRTECRR